MNNINPKLDWFFEKDTKWQKECAKLRMILLDPVATEYHLTEELKWRQPCYTFQNSNIVLLGLFKEYCALSFFKGVLLNDVNSILVAPGENSQSVRLIKFTDVQEIIKMEPILKTFIQEAIEIEKAGLKVNLKKNTALTFPEELQNKLNERPAFKTAFEGLTPGRQRAYNLYFSSAKQAKTRELRIEKYTQRILEGKGINDCTCGLSKKLPNCDGSHKYIKV